MTRNELTHTRDLYFSGWIRKNLPDSNTGLVVSDLDFILCNWKMKRIILLEIKTRNSELKQWQYLLFMNLNKWIRDGISNDWSYLGFHILKFENTNFENGKVYFDDIPVNEQEVIKRLSL